MNVYKNDSNKTVLNHRKNNWNKVKVVGYAKGYDGRQIPIISFDDNQNSIEVASKLSSEQVLKVAGSKYIMKRFQKSMRRFDGIVNRNMRRVGD